MKRTRYYQFALVGLAFLPLIVMGISPIALNSGGAPAWSGGSFASVSTATTGCPAYAFSAESTLGLGRAGTDELCIGSASAYVSIKHNSSKTQLQFNTAPSTTTPHLAEVDNPTRGFNISDATNPFSWVANNAEKWYLKQTGGTGGTTYLCPGPNATDTICFTSANGADLVLRRSDGGSFTGNFSVGVGTFQLSDGTAAAPTYVFDNGNTGFYSSAANTLNLSIDGTNAGTLGSLNSTTQGPAPASGYYIKVDSTNGRPAAGDCGSGTNYNGKVVYDYTNHQLIVCNDVSASRTDWDATNTLTD